MPLTQPSKSTQNADDNDDDNGEEQPPTGPVQVEDLPMPDHFQGKDAERSAYEMRQMHKGEHIHVINRLRNKPVNKSRLNIPLCRLKPHPKVRPIIEHDVEKLMHEFNMGYREGDRVLYVSLFSSKDNVLKVKPTDDFLENPHWKAVNDEFEKLLMADPDLHQFSDMYFYVYEGNHRLTAWTRHIEKHHPNDPSWYFSVDCIILDARKQIPLLLEAMTDINW